MYEGILSPIRCFASVGRYYQGPDAIKILPGIVSKEGRSVFAVIDEFFYDDFKISLKTEFNENGLRFESYKAERQISDDSISRIKACVERMDEIPDVFLGIGGGKTCDVIKCMGDIFRKPVIEVPTALATDAPPTSHSMVYRDDGSSYVYAHLRSPEYVVVDTTIAVNAPPRTFSSGLGDALATYYESVAIHAFGHPTLAGRSNYRRTRTGMAIARLCYDIIMENGVEAYESAKSHHLSQAFEDTAEALTLLSGLGVENTGCSVAHGLEKYLHKIEGIPLLHGQGVGFGTLVQILLENRPESEFLRVYQWCKSVDLPVCFADIGITDNVEESISRLASDAIHDYLINREPFEVTEKGIIEALRKLESYSGK